MEILPYLSALLNFGNLSKSKNLETPLQQFIKNFEVKYKAKMISCHAENDAEAEDNNMFSGLPRLKFTYKERRKTESGKAVLKIPSLTPSPNDPNEQLRKTNMLDREEHFYKTILPKLYELGECKPFAPILYAATEAKVLVLEDLSADGFQPGDQFNQLDLDQSRISLDLLATYHALSYGYLRDVLLTDPGWNLIRSYQPILKNRLKKDSFDKFCTMIKPYLTQSLYQKISRLQNKILATPKIPEPLSMTVIIHGDFRKNNILFKYKENKVCEAKLINWQLSRTANPVLDLIYFFVTSVPIEIIESYEEELQNFYLETLTNRLISLDPINSYNKHQFDDDMKDYNYHYLKTICITWQEIMRAGPTDAETDQHISSTVKWLRYLSKKGII
ncbi:hypothetical protein V9T40_011378 [Parthenolecanium corni]|uniref:CHK kinase-like domain-containing protein n=1 Tax=Parthenolecanium corni TaxID=536013 RepID=A0AAN9T5A2_9HEMI